MARSTKLEERINQLLALAERTLATCSEYREGYLTKIDEELYNEFKTGCLSFLLNLYGKEHPYYISYVKAGLDPWAENVIKSRGILKAVKAEIEGGWLGTIKGLIAAEVFADFFEMAEHLLQEGYKDPAAVVIGSVLEEHLRQLCGKNNISVEYNKSDKLLPKKADLLNAELCGAGVYTKLDQKGVTAWLDLRNKAAHGQYKEYDQSQVELYLQNVRDFILRNSL